MSLEERKNIVEKIKQNSLPFLANMIEDMGFDVGEIKGNNIHFTIDGKNYYLYVNVNRDRKSHQETKYVGGTGCCQSVDDSPYESVTVYDEDE